MSWDKTTCCCGGPKERETMFCDECRAFLLDRCPADYRTIQDTTYCVGIRRAAAVRCLSQARRRNRKQKPLALHFQQ